MRSFSLSSYEGRAVVVVVVVFSAASEHLLDAKLLFSFLKCNKGRAVFVAVVVVVVFSAASELF